jgi:hypothetical protein
VYALSSIEAVTSTMLKMPLTFTRWDGELGESLIFLGLGQLPGDFTHPLEENRLVSTRRVTCSW